MSLLIALCAGLLPTLARQAHAEQPNEHIVRRGESVWLIAQRYGVSPSVIVDLNGLENPSLIYAGTTLLVSAPVDTATDKANDGSQAPSLVLAESIEFSGPGEHIVQRGENVWSIAQSYGVSSRSIVEVNRLESPRLVHAGLRLQIPLRGDGPLFGGGVAKPSFENSVANSGLSGGAVVVGEPGQSTSIGIARSDNGVADAPAEVEFALAVAPDAGVAPASSQQVESAQNAGERAGPPSDLGALQAASSTDTSPEEPAAETAVLAEPPAVLGGAEEAAFVQDWFPQTYRITFYCLPGRMANGRVVHEGAVAADASIWSFGTELEIEGLGLFTVQDRFAYDAGQLRLDVWVPDCRHAIQMGVKHLRVRLLDF